MAKAIGITPQAISQWGDELTEAQTDRVIAAAWRARVLHKLEDFRKKATPSGAAPEIKESDLKEGMGL